MEGEGQARKDFMQEDGISSSETRRMSRISTDMT